MCHHKMLAWSNHLGGEYSASVEGQTIKSAKPSPHLMTSSIYDELSVALNDKEKKLLKKSLNRSLKNAWLGNVKRGGENFNIRRYCYVKGDFLFYLYMIFISFLPMRSIYLVYKKIK